VSTTRPFVAVASLVAFTGFFACDSFSEGTTTVPDAGAADGASSSGGSSGSSGSDGGSIGADGAPKSGCASLSNYLLCSDFDVSTDLGQPTLPDAKKWTVAKDPEDSLSIDANLGLSPSNALKSSGNGTAEKVRAQLVMPNMIVTKDTLRLRTALRIDALPGGDGDIYFATMGFADISFAAIMHADGTLAVAQSVAPGTEQPTKSPQPTAALSTGQWQNVDLVVHRNTNEVSVELNFAPGAPAQILVPATGPATVQVGIGYCDPSCGNPSFLFDDVVFMEE
jgi:hypothetical protein